MQNLFQTAYNDFFPHSLLPELIKYQNINYYLAKKCCIPILLSKWLLWGQSKRWFLIYWNKGVFLYYLQWDIRKHWTDSSFVESEQGDTLEINYKMAEKLLSLRVLGEDFVDACLPELPAASTKQNKLQINWGRLRAVFTNPASPWHRLTFLSCPFLFQPLSAFNPHFPKYCFLRSCGYPSAERTGKLSGCLMFCRCCLADMTHGNRRLTCGRRQTGRI